MEICLYDPARLLFAPTPNNSAKRETSTPPATFMPSSDACWRASLKRYGRRSTVPPQIEILELGPGRGLFARDVLDWSRKKFPDFFAALNYTLQETSPALRAKLQETLREHIDSRQSRKSRRDTARRSPHALRSIARTARLLSSSSPTNSSTPSPWKFSAPAGKLHIALEDKRLREIWLPPLAEELEFLDRYGVHPEAEETSASKCPSPRSSGSQQIVQPIHRGVAARHRLRLHAQPATRRPPPRHAHGVSPSLRQPRPLPGSRRTGPHRPRQFHRARRGLRASRNEAAKSCSRNRNS